MKNLLKLLPFLVLIIVLGSCDKNTDDDCVCIEIYDPVCGDDGMEYSNSCYADCAGVNYTAGTCPLTISATVRDLGNPALDGCGWILEFEVNGENENHRPDTLAEAFMINDLAVQLTYQVTTDSSICGLAAMIPLIEVVEIVE